MQKVFKVGLIGCGHIAETYFKGHKYFNTFRIITCADIKHSAAKDAIKLKLDVGEDQAGAEVQSRHGQDQEVHAGEGNRTGA